MTASTADAQRGHLLAVPAPDLIATTAGLLIPLVLVAAWAVADAVQPTSYSAVRQTVSVAAGLGAQDRWIMTGGLLVVGTCYLVSASTSRRLNPAGRVGLVLAGLSAIAIAASPQPAGGTTLRHAVVTTVGAVVIALWPAVARATGGTQPWLLRTLSRATVTVVSVVLLAWMAWETRDGTLLGLAERLSATVQVCWPAVVLLALDRTVTRR